MAIVRRSLVQLDLPADAAAALGGWEAFREVERSLHDGRAMRRPQSEEVASARR